MIFLLALKEEFFHEKDEEKLKELFGFGFIGVSI